MDGSLPALPADLKPARTGDGREPPAVLRRVGAVACFAADEFFSVRISNAETRRAYGRTVRWFLAWCDDENIELAGVTPGLAGRFLRDPPISDAIKNQALAALRHFFDALVTRHAVVLNPFQLVRGVQHQVLDGKTPEFSLSQARRLFAAIKLDSPMGLRDRAMLGTLITTGCRIGALCRLRVSDLRTSEDGRSLRFREKNGQTARHPRARRPGPVAPEYIEAARIAGDPPSALLWRGPLRGGSVTRWQVNQAAVRAMLKCRLAAAGLPAHLTPHSFRVMVVAALLNQNVPVEEVQHLVGHSHPSTTQLYDRRRRRINRSIVERIPFWPHSKEASQSLLRETPDLFRHLKMDRSPTRPASRGEPPWQKKKSPSSNP